MTTPDTAPVPTAPPDGAGPGARAYREPVEARLIATGTVLDSIVQARRERIDELRARFGHLRAEDLERSQRSFAAALRTRSGQELSPQPALIMECKAASPSRGTIRSDYDPASLAAQYAPYAAAVSVLTEPDRFNGSFDDLAAVREVVDAVPAPLPASCAAVVMPSRCRATAPEAMCSSAMVVPSARLSAGPARYSRAPALTATASRWAAWPRPAKTSRSRCAFPAASPPRMSWSVHLDTPSSSGVTS